MLTNCRSAYQGCTSHWGSFFGCIHVIYRRSGLGCFHTKWSLEATSTPSLVTEMHAYTHELIQRGGNTIVIQYSNNVQLWPDNIQGKCGDSETWTQWEVVSMARWCKDTCNRKGWGHCLLTPLHWRHLQTKVLIHLQRMSSWSKSSELECCLYRTLNTRVKPILWRTYYLKCELVQLACMHTQTHAYLGSVPRSGSVIPKKTTSLLEIPARSSLKTEVGMKSLTSPKAMVDLAPADSEFFHSPSHQCVTNSAGILFTTPADISGACLCLKFVPLGPGFCGNRYPVV